MRIFSNPAFLFIIPLLFGLVAQEGGCRSMKVAHMPEKEARLKAGMWGGNRINLEVTGDSTLVEFDCAHGTINHPLILDQQGRFEARGTYVAEGHGPTRSGNEPEGSPARYYGSVSGETMSLTVEVGGSAATKTSYTLTHGRQGKLNKCG
jgi:phenylpropionate dioxygenase-like ring-hydroxylating dioxygenase large terminal subunit